MKRERMRPLLYLFVIVIAIFSSNLFLEKTKDGVSIPSSGFHIIQGGTIEDSLAPKNTARVPFIKFLLANSTESIVDVSSITVRIDQPEYRDAFVDIEILDQFVSKIGTAEQLTSDGSTDIVINTQIQPNEVQEYTLVAHMSDCGDPCSRNAQIVSMQITAVDASAPVEGKLPIPSSQHTYNAQLTVGRMLVTPQTVSALSQTGKSSTLNTFQVKNTGNEEILISEVRFTNTGTLVSSDFDNLKITFDKEVFPVAWSPDGVHAIAALSKKIALLADETLTVTLSGDIKPDAEGYAQFNIHDVTDLYAIGLTYGYGIKVDTPSGTITKPFLSGLRIDARSMGTLPSVL